MKSSPKITITNLPQYSIKPGMIDSSRELSISAFDLDQFLASVQAVLRSKISTAPKNRLLKFTILAGTFDEVEEDSLVNAPSTRKEPAPLRSTSMTEDLNVFRAE